jgi:hypothetical protein
MGFGLMSDEQVKEQIQAIKEVSEKALSDREYAIKILFEGGLLDSDELISLQAESTKDSTDAKSSAK